ncbi:MAG: hypothetical protein D6709_09190 [Chloroflexi bacterium]|uniref:Endonuclease MutS2 n=2 Tax=Candidatus Thermofonsia Clade 3 TaxID=2364209 RepID=A0A2M8QCN7_9CHLR|nr:MAG: hypothetical protein CUN48_08010 [Candidatus Thermofonsia Clade 3 bacterium]RMG63224.1 MAG: hypothetical protein D6709_09190 [Chloroflexota bacterium]
MNAMIELPGYLQKLQARLLAGDPAARRELERLALLSNLQALAEEATQAGALREHRFAPSLPLIGRAVAALRTALFAITARWPLRVLIAQQTQVNQATARALTESLKLNEYLLARIEALEARVTELERARHG